MLTALFRIDKAPQGHSGALWNTLKQQKTQENQSRHSCWLVCIATRPDTRPRDYTVHLNFWKTPDPLQHQAPAFKIIRSQHSASQHLPGHVQQPSKPPQQSATFFPWWFYDSPLHWLEDASWASNGRTICLPIHLSLSFLFEISQL